MRRRDWIGTALLAIVLIVIPVDFHAWLNKILIPVAFILAAWLVRELWHNKKGGGQSKRSVTIRGLSSSLTVPPGATVDVSMLERFPSGGTTRKIPDFTEEWQERDRLLQRCAGEVEEPEAVWAWVQGVYGKLLSWSPKQALEFKPDPSAITEILSPPRIPPIVASLVKGVKVNRSRQNLTLYGERLAKILDEERKQ